MNTRFLLVLFLSLLILIVKPLVIQAAEPCAKGKVETSDYQLRDSNGNRRCEGIIPSQTIGRNLELASLAVGRLQQTNPLTLKIPEVSSNQPKINVYNPEKSYRVDNVDLTQDNGWFQMRWSNSVLRDKGIAPDSLFAIAEIPPSGSSTTVIHVPIFLSPDSGKYEIVFDCDECEANIETFEVSYGNQKMSCTENIGDRHTPRFLCDGRNAPPGKYKILASYEIKPTESSSYESVSPIITYFKHDPQWLK